MKTNKTPKSMKMSLLKISYKKSIKKWARQSTKVRRPKRELPQTPGV
jgi:hypothetical protein